MIPTSIDYRSDAIFPIGRTDIFLGLVPVAWVERFIDVDSCELNITTLSHGQTDHRSLMVSPSIVESLRMVRGFLSRTKTPTVKFSDLQIAHRENSRRTWAEAHA
jgi:hypothetical protein